MHVGPLAGKQLDSVALSAERLNIWEGSVRSSKTISSLIAWLKFVRHGPPGNLLMSGRTERTLKRNVVDVLTEMLGPQRCKLISGAGELYLLGRRVYLAGANDERAQEKIRGLSLSGAYGDELTTWPESYFVMLLSRLSEHGAQLYGSTNAEGPGHWLKRDYLDRAAVHLTQDREVIRTAGEDTLNLARFSFRLADNPHLPPDYVASLVREYQGLWRKRLIDGEWCVAEGAVYDMWDEALHVVDIIPPIQTWLCVSVDYGTTNPLHALLIGLGVDGRLYVTAEWRWDSRRAHRQLTDAEYSLRLRQWIQQAPIPATRLTGPVPQFWVVDPSAASFITQLHADGLSPAGANNEVLDGIRLVSTVLAMGKLKIHRSCRELIREIPGYSWSERDAQRGEDKPVKVDDHGCDSLRYGLMTTRSLWRQVIPLGSESPAEQFWGAA